MPKDLNQRVSLLRWSPSGIEEKDDHVVKESPLAIKIAQKGGGEAETLALTMRSPGDDLELVAGYLFSEGVIGRAEDILSSRSNSDFSEVTVELSCKKLSEKSSAQRKVLTSSSCGLCGRQSLKDLPQSDLMKNDSEKWSIEKLQGLNSQMEKYQDNFSQSGGLHAAAYFDAEGKLEFLREDVGRHNALDKLVGRLLLDGRVPLGKGCVMVSGRVAFELVHKASLAQIPLLVAIGAPSSMAIELATEKHMTVIGFLRDRSFNIYCGAERVSLTNTHKLQASLNV